MDKQGKVKAYRVTRTIDEIYYVDAPSKKEAELAVRHSCDPQISLLKKVKVEMYKR